MKPLTLIILPPRIMPTTLIVRIISPPYFWNVGYSQKLLDAGNVKID